jgi:hypothetical protein
MKKTYSLLFITYSLFVFAQVPAIDWQKTLGGNNSDFLYSICPTSDGGFIYGGSSSSPISGDKTMNCQGNGFTDCWIIKTNTLGAIQWQKSIGGYAGEAYTQIFQTADGGYIMGCSSMSNISGDKTENSFGYTDYWIVKLDALGNVVWDKTLGGSALEYFTSLIQTPDGGYLVGGYSDSPMSGNKTENFIGYVPNLATTYDDYWVVKLDALGAIEWQNTIGSTGGEVLNSIITTSDSGYLLVGFSAGLYADGDKTQLTRGGYDYWIVKIDNLGAVVWDKTIGGNKGDNPNDVSITFDGNFLITGSSNSDVSGEKTDAAYATDYSDVWLIELDNLGNIIWQKTIGGSSVDTADSITPDENSGYLLGCWSDSNTSFDKTENSRGGSDFWLVKIDSSGNIQWDKTIGGAQDESIKAVCLVPADNSFIVGGFSSSSNTGDKTEVSRGLNDYWVVKLQPENLSTHNFATTTARVYPNPTVKRVTFDFNESYSNLNVKLFNLVGQLVNEQKFQNTSNLSIDINGESGVYFVEIENENYEKKTFKIVKN